MEAVNEAYIKAENLTLYRGGEPVLENLSFTAPLGTALIITGDNGAGKTTLIRAIAGLLPLKSGILTFAGKPLLHNPIVQENMIYIGHQHSMTLKMTAAENLIFWAKLHGVKITKQNIENASEALGITSILHREIGLLSEGQKRRCGLLKLAVGLDRKIWLLDEPLTALDATAGKQLLQLIDKHTENGGIVIAATHHPLSLSRAIHLDLAVATS